MTKDTGISKRGRPPTRTKKEQTDTGTGSSVSTKPTSETSKKSSNASLEEEAKQFRKRKSPPRKPKPMTSRIYLAGQAMSALLVRSAGHQVRMEDIKREAFDWADFMLKDD